MEVIFMKEENIQQMKVLLLFNPISTRGGGADLPPFTENSAVDSLMVQSERWYFLIFRTHFKPIKMIPTNLHLMGAPKCYNEGADLPPRYLKKIQTPRY